MVVRANRKRVFYLDLLKFVSIYAMIVCHLFYNYYSYTHESAQGMILSGRIRQQETKRTDSRFQGIKPWLWRVLKWAQRKDHRSLICNKTR